MKRTSKFRSGLEERVAELLSELGISYEYESNKIAYTISHYYIPDFILPNGTILETKGYFGPEDRRKIKNLVQQNEDIVLKMIFQAPYNKISKGSKTTYAKWCDRLGIEWAAFHNIPLEWLI